MKLKMLITLLLITTFLASCAPGTTTPVSAPTATLPAEPSPTLTPTMTPTITPTPVTYLPGLSTKVPEPDAAFIENVVNENYLSVMGLTRVQVILSYKEHSGIDGQPYVVMVDDSMGVPLAVYTQGQWQESTLKFFGAQDGIVMGTDTLEAYTPTDIQIMSSFERATIEVGNDWVNDEPQQGQINPDEAAKAQKLENDLNKNGVTEIIAHNTINPGTFPDWLKNGNFTKDELRTIMQNRIQYMIDQNPTANFLVVVNEPWQYDTPSQEYDVFYKAWGNSYDYIPEAFQMARDYAKAKNRNIQLIFNWGANNSLHGITSESTRKIVNMLHEKRLIDYVGMQMHLNQWSGVTNGQVNTESIAAELKYYKDIGVPILFTELTYEPTQPNELAMSPLQREEELAQIFSDVFTLAIDSGNVKGITFWGVTDAYLHDVNWYQIYGDSSLPKQAYYAVLKVLYEGIKN